MMRDLIKKILKENISFGSVPSIRYKSLSDGNKESIKSNGVQIFDRFKLMDYKELNDFFREKGLFYGSPSEEYLKKNIEDIDFALKELPLKFNTRKKLVEKKDALERQSKEGGRNYEFFHEIPKKEQEKMVWSVVNLFDNNIMLWIRLINDWLISINHTKPIKSISSLINYYFNLENGDKAFEDLKNAMINRETHNQNIIKYTWGGGQKVEQDFVSELLRSGFDVSDIYMFSGEKNIIDGIGIDLAVKCSNNWIPFQVKSDVDDANNSVPYEGFSTFPYKKTFKLVSSNKVQINLEDFCKPLDIPDVDSEKKSTIPPNVDYVAHMGWDKDLDN
jgi:hypothetical protein